MGKLELIIHNIYIMVYIIIVGLLSILVSDKFLYLLWFFVGKDVALFIYIPFIFLFYQIYIKYTNRVYISYFTLILNAIIMLIVSYFIIVSALLNYNFINY